MRVELTPDVFSAIATPVRRDIIRRLAAENDQTITTLASFYPMSRQAVTRHIKVLHETGVISMHKDGREQICHFQAQALKDVYDWVKFYEQFWDDKLDRLGEFLAAED